MKLRKYVVIGLLWFVVLAVQVTSKTETIQYMIHYDSEAVSTFEIKDEILKRYAQLIDGVQEESAILMVIHNLDQFAWDETLKAEWVDNHLQVTQGDGQGTLIQGDLKAPGICFPEVKPKSWIAELLQ